jgi:hypothetical protein
MASAYLTTIGHDVTIRQKMAKAAFENEMRQGGEI